MLHYTNAVIVLIFFFLFNYYIIYYYRLTAIRDIKSFNIFYLFHKNHICKKGHKLKRIYWLLATNYKFLFSGIRSGNDNDLHLDLE